ncbi:ABC transporter permease subunit [Lentisphaera profundi]|uniref:ABC transporter permease subunit n=1 Tax=Lentisphaera profundi TaxID=1658616 RepID=A0ABY7VR89_9BACT|nr:ABC transporter permease subunit [Lentisphaera profundi]WDE96723.1 ABC transporter permease subunit [Lentisphaera profundi]
MIVDNFMATVLLGGLILAVFSADRVMGREISQGTAGFIFSKPISRVEYVLGKIVGVILVMVFYSLCSSMELLISLRCAGDQFRLDWGVYILLACASLVIPYLGGALRNYLKGGNFCQSSMLMLMVSMCVATLVAQFLPGHSKEEMGLNGQVARGFLVLGFALALMGTIAVSLMTRLRVTGTFVMMFLVFLGGATADYFFGITAEKGSIIAKMVYLILPNWQSFWQAEALAIKIEIPFTYISWSFIYMSAMIAFFSALACTLFQSRELHEDNNS